MKQVFWLALVAFVHLGCGSADGVSVGDDSGWERAEDDTAERGPLGKADQFGSCEGACGGQSTGNCWCDERCELIGDCCADKAFVCGVDPAGQSSSLRVAVVSDLNGSYGSTSYNSYVHGAIDRIAELSPDLVLSTGDMVAGQKAGLDYHAMWQGFHAAVSEPFAQAGIPFAVTPGNHDGSAYAGYSEEREIFAEQWLARRPDVSFHDESHYPFRYSFSVGNAFFVSLDATTVGPLDTEQMGWLDQQLAQGTGYAARIVFGHVPLYPTARDMETAAIADPDLEALFVEREVDLFIAGHHHAYYPGRRDDLRLLSMACLGSGRRKLMGTNSSSARSFALFDVTSEGIVELDAYAGSRFTDVIARATLPESVGTGEQVIVRDDLPWPLE